MSEPIVSLRPLTRTDLAAITPWFEDTDTRRYLGGPDWPAAMLDHSETRAVAWRGTHSARGSQHGATLTHRVLGFAITGLAVAR